MKAFLQIDLNITNLDLFLQYVDRIPELIHKHEGQYLVQGVEPQVIEGGDFVPEHSVVIEFPALANAEAFLQERAESDLHAIWTSSTNSRILLLTGTT